MIFFRLRSDSAHIFSVFSGGAIDRRKKISCSLIESVIYALVAMWSCLSVPWETRMLFGQMKVPSNFSPSRISLRIELFMHHFTLSSSSPAIGTCVIYEISVPSYSLHDRLNCRSECWIHQKRKTKL